MCVCFFYQPLMFFFVYGILYDKMYNITNIFNVDVAVKQYSIRELGLLGFFPFFFSSRFRP